MPVHYLTHEFSPFRGGISLYVEEMARATAANGVETTVWAPDYDSLDLDEFPFEVNRVKMRGKHDWICRWKMGRAFSGNFPEGKLDGTIVLAEPGPIRWWMYEGLNRPPVADRLVLILHGSEVQKLAALPHRRILFKRLLRRADVIGVVSHRVRKMVLSICPGIQNRLEVVPGAVRSSWQKEKAPKWKYRRLEVLQVGRVHPRKGQLELVTAISYMPKALREKISVRLIGPISRESYAVEIHNFAEDNQIDLKIVGSVEESGLMEAYKQASVVVMPSQPYKTSMEGLGIALLEAQHFGCPVIGTDSGGIREAMIPDETGLLVPVGNTDALAQCIGRILQNPGLADEMGFRGAGFVREDFSWEKNVRLLELS